MASFGKIIRAKEWKTVLQGSKSSQVTLAEVVVPADEHVCQQTVADSDQEA
jgi:hypothetical protein